MFGKRRFGSKMLICILHDFRTLTDVAVFIKSGASSAPKSSPQSQTRHIIVVREHAQLGMAHTNRDAAQRENLLLMWLKLETQTGRIKNTRHTTPKD